jgi:hypothetical protein
MNRVLPRLVRTSSNFAATDFPSLGLTNTAAMATVNVSPMAFSLNAWSKFPRLALATLRVVPQNGQG